MFVLVIIVILINLVIKFVVLGVKLIICLGKGYYISYVSGKGILF